MIAFGIENKGRRMLDTPFLRRFMAQVEFSQRNLRGDLTEGSNQLPGSIVKGLILETDSS